MNAAKEKQSAKLSQNLEEQTKRLKNKEDELRKTKLETDKYYKALSSIRDGLQLNMSIADCTLQKTKQKSAQNSPCNSRDSDSGSSKQCKTEKNSNGVNSESSGNVQVTDKKVKTEKDDDMNVD